MPRLDNQFDGSFHFIIYCHVGKFRHAAYMDAIETEIASCQDKSFHGLIHRSCTDRLDFCPVMFANDASNGASDRGCP
jgi:hypothetical protein